MHSSLSEKKKHYLDLSFISWSLAIGVFFNTLSYCQLKLSLALGFRVHFTDDQSP